jgi:hypothetical protein
MQGLVKNILILLGVLVLLTACSKDKEKYVKSLNKKQQALSELLNYIETNYSDILNKRAHRERVVFVDCDKAGNISDDYICECEDVLKKMKDIDISEVRFEKVKVNCETNKVFTEVYFQEHKIFYYPVVYYLYEYCEAGTPLETNTIYYKPVNEHWSVYIDSNFP